LLMKRVLFIIVLAILLLPVQILAVEGRNGDGNDDDRVRIEVRQRQDQEQEIRIENRVEIQGNEFEITGQVTAMGRDSITISGQQIFIDPDLVGNFQERGIVAVGSTAKVEGEIRDNKLFAREITVFGGDSLRDEVKIEIKGDTEQLGSRGALQELMDLINRFLANLDSIRPSIR